MIYCIRLPLLLLLVITDNPWAHGISEADQHAMMDGGILQYTWLGAMHMLTGYDHLLFLLGVVFFLTRFKDILKFITAFTVGHSITLIFATFYQITANYFLIDSVIALTVCYKGFDNLDGFRKIFNVNSPNLLAAVFLFGLIHGFGLSTRLQQLPLGDQGLLGRILGFNVGVELGQVIALTVLVMLLAGWRKTDSFYKLSTVTNFALIAAGVGLFLMQILGYFQHHELEYEHSDKFQPAITAPLYDAGQAPPVQTEIPIIRGEHSHDSSDHPGHDHGKMHDHHHNHGHGHGHSH